MNRVRAIARDWLPPALIRLLLPWLGMGVDFRGRYASIAEARAVACGYAGADILGAAAHAVREVLEGRAVAERDGVLLERKVVPFPVAAELLFRASQSLGKGVAVCDFGGSLGSTYRACSDFLAGVPSVSWGVVELPMVAAYGREHLQDGRLSFHESVEACSVAVRPDVLLLSSVLQYLDDPFSFLADMARGPWESIVIDRTPLIASGDSFVVTQHVPPQWTRAVFPCWLFARQALLQSVGKFELVAEFPALDGRIGRGRRCADFTGFILRRQASCR